CIHASKAVILPRFIRYRDAPGYLGTDRARFDDEIRPQLTEIPIGERGIAFDRHELDAWADAYISARGRPGSRKPKKGTELCEPGRKASSSTREATGWPTSGIAASGSSSASARSPKTTPR